MSSASQQGSQDSKSFRNLHKTRIAKSDRNVAKGARAALHKMLREQKRATVSKEKRASEFDKQCSPCHYSLPNDLLRLLSNESNGVLASTAASSEYKLRATILKAPHGDLAACMEMAKVADLIAFVASASLEEAASDHTDPFGAQCLSVFRSLGLPSKAVFLRGLPTDLEKRNEAKKLCTYNLAGEFPEDCKFYPADSKDDMHKFLWLFKEQRVSVPHWRSQRPYLLSHKVEMLAADENSGKCTLLRTGYVRAHSVSVNQLLQKIEVLKDPCPFPSRKERNARDADDLFDAEVIRSMYPDPLSQEPLVAENVPDPLAGEQTWPTEAEMSEADRDHKQKIKKKRALPQGTSEYQAAWILDGTDEEASDDDSDLDDGMVLDEIETLFLGPEGTKNRDFEDDEASLYLRESDEETEADSMMMYGENLTREQIEDEIKKIKEAHAEDEEFPDEVDTLLDIPARKRFVKYRGLKSLRTSSWDPKESLPQEYAKIFAFDNFTKTQKHVFANAFRREEEHRDDCISAGQYARLHIKEVSVVLASHLCASVETKPVLACGLLQHESKMSVLHFSIKKCDTYEAPIKSKEELVFVGFRQFVARPIFSSDIINLDKHKMERFLLAGHFSVASIFSPISFAPLPLIVLKNEDGGGAPTVTAVGSLRSINPDRIILKKIILTGYPQSVSKLKATVRYMFHNPEDPVEVWTKCARRGRIKEPVGTHGQATFHGRN